MNTKALLGVMPFYQIILSESDYQNELQIVIRKLENIFGPITNEMISSVSPT